MAGHGVRRWGAGGVALLLFGGAPAACGSGGPSRTVATTRKVAATSTTSSAQPLTVAGPAVLSVRTVRVGPNPSPPYGADVDDLPRWMVTPDGWLFTADIGEDGTRAKPPVPPVTAQRLDSTALRSLRAMATTAGLDRRPAAAPSPAQDAPAVELAYRDESGLLAVQRHVTPGPAVQAVLDALARPSGAFGAGHVGSARSYSPAAARYWASPLRARSTGVPAWPLRGAPLAAASDCSFVQGTEAATVLAALRSAPAGARLTRTASGLVQGRWRDAGGVFTVSVRVLLPGEAPCPDLPR